MSNATRSKDGVAADVGSDDIAETRDANQRISFRLSLQARKAVDEIMELAGIDSLQDAIRRALSDELFILRERKDGWSILLRKGSKYREVRWPDI
jgi:hypothetical protein